MFKMSSYGQRKKHYLSHFGKYRNNLQYSNYVDLMYTTLENKMKIIFQSITKKRKPVFVMKKAFSLVLSVNLFQLPVCETTIKIVKDLLNMS